jgi:branched-chain amino acid transport system ATP-binding protein
MRWEDGGPPAVLPSTFLGSEEMTVMLEAKNVVKRFGGLVAVDHVSMTVHQGQIVGLIGPNGAGKTTFLNSISGTYTPDGGTVHFLGKKTTGFRSDTMCHLGLSRTFQISQPFPKLTALENVKVSSIFGRQRDGRGEHDSWSREMLDYVEFPMPADTMAENLNTVQLKRLDLARALASKPKLLLLDELAAGLTTGELDDLMDIIRKINASGITIVMVEHIMRVIMGLCEHVVVIHYGKKIAEGEMSEVANDPNVTEAYLGEEYML